MVPAASRQAQQPRRTAVLLALILAAASAVTGDGRLPRFEAVSEPVWRPEDPPLPQALVPRTEHPEAASWACLEVGTAPRAELDALVRLSVLLEASQEARTALVTAQAATRTAAEPLLAPLGDAVARRLATLSELGPEPPRPQWLPSTIDPLGRALDGPEAATWTGWSALLPIDGRCEDPAALTGWALAVALVTQEHDAVAAVAGRDLAVLVRQGRALAGLSMDTPSTRLAGLVDDLETALAKLETAEQSWREPRSRIAGLLAAVVSERGLEDAAAAIALQRLRQDVAGPDGIALAADRVLSRTAARLATSAALAVPELIVEQRTFLDLEYTPEGSSRRDAVARLVASLGDQLGTLERLHRARTARRAAFRAAAPAPPYPTLDGFDRAAEEQWWRLARMVQLLDQPGLASWRRAWAWTEIGIARDRLLSLESALAGLEQDALWIATGDTTAYRASADVQDRVLAALATMRATEAAPLASLRDDAENVLAEAAAATTELAQLATAARASADDPDTGAFLGVVEAWLSRRAATLREAFALARELRTARPAGTEPPPPSFAQVALALRELPELERQIAERSDTGLALLALGRPGPATNRDAMLLDIAADLDLPAAVSVDRGRGTLTLTFGGGAESASVSVSTNPAARARSRGATSAGAAFAVLTWTGSHRDPPLLWQIAPASSAPSPDDAILIDPRRMPPGWIEQQRQLQQSPNWNIASHVGAEVANNWIGYGVGMAAIGVGAFVSAPVVILAGGTMIGINALKDAATGAARAVNAAHGAVDPRDRAMVDRGITISRTWVDMITLVVGVGGAEKAADWIDNVASGAGLGWSAAQGGSPTPSDPYLERIARADVLIDEAYAAAKACRWPEALATIQKALAEDPYTRSLRWTPIGSRVMSLALEWEAFGRNAAAALASARERARDEVYGCGPEATTVAEHLRLSYVDEARWACDTAFETEMKAYAGLGERLAEIRSALAAAEASCDAAAAAGLARQVVAWAEGPGRGYRCSELLKLSADEVLTWALNPAEDPAARLSRARQAIEACRLDDARELLTAPGPPDRCADAGLTATLDETRAELWERLRARERDGGRLETLAQEAAAAQAACDRERLSALLAELEGLRFCVEGGEARRAELADQLRQSLELTAGRSLELLDQVRDAFNEAIRLADTGCDMTRAWAELQRAASLLDGLSASACAQFLGGEVGALEQHGRYVRGQVEAREAALARIRASYSAGDAAFSAALATCSRAGLLEAAALLGEAVAGIDGLPVLADPSCAAILQLSVEATALKDEASTLVGYWDGVAGDLDRARLAAAEGRQIALETSCAGLRQKAHPASCFAAELAECDGLVPATTPAVTGSITPPPPSAPPPSSPPATGGGSAWIQVDDPEPCARDVHWVPARQRFECTCPGYRFDDILERCVAGGAAAAVSQATCDAQYPGTRLGSDPETGQPACLCPAGSAWSGSHGRCLELAVTVTGPAARMACDPSRGRFYDPATGRCDCLVGRWDEQLGRCVDTAAADRQRQVDAGRQAAECERLYSDIQVFRRNPDALSQAQAAAAEARASRLGCDPGRIADARARGSRPIGPAPPAGSTASGQVAPETGSTPDSAGVGTCHIQEYPGQGEVTVVFEQRALGAHLNVYVVPANEDDLEGIIAHMSGLPGYRHVGTYASPAAASNAARGLCQGREMR